MNPELIANEKLIKARVQLLLSHPFFAALALRLQLVGKPVKTMATDGRAIYYSREFVDSLTPAELQGVLAHEVMHCALGHHCRRGDRTAKRWNYACDYAINPLLLDNGFELPEGALLKPEFQGLSAEEIYSKLASENEGGGSQAEPEPGGAAAGSGQGSPDPGETPQSQPTAEDDENTADNAGGETPSDPNSSTGEEATQAPLTHESGTQEPEYAPGFGEVLDAVDDEGVLASEAEKSKQQRDWAIAAQQAANAAKTCGHSPLGIDRVLADTCRSHVDWRAILRDFVAATTPADYRFCPPNRRYVHAGLYLPSIHKEGTGPLVIAVDTSGSIGTEELNQFAGEITAIAEEAQPELIHVVYCDAAVQSVQEFGPSEAIKLEPKGGGGTDFRPVFEWVNKNGIDPACLIYLTDLCCSDYPSHLPSYPVLWVTDSRRTAPFGETVQIVPD